MLLDLAVRINDLTVQQQSNAALRVRTVSVLYRPIVKALFVLTAVAGVAFPV
jgi:hypothetical protein